MRPQCKGIFKKERIPLLPLVQDAHSFRALAGRIDAGPKGRISIRYYRGT